MAKRIKLGLIFTIDSNWIAGTYYILNLIHAINKIPDEKKPTIVILCGCENEFKHLQKDTSYPYLKYINPYTYKPNIIKRLINKLFKVLFKHEIFNTKLSDNDVDVVFPYIENEYFNCISNRLYWIPDFQDHFYPKFFTKKELDSRLVIQRRIINSNTNLVVSSNASLNDLKRLFPEFKCKVFVMNFAVTLSNFNNIKPEDLLLKYNIDQKYFIVSNQFWQHKNHQIVIKAVKEILDFGKEETLVVFTGKERDTRKDGYYKYLQDLVNNFNIKTNIRFLGFVDRIDQLQLINQSIAVIQPSLFEGWSTIFEDAKSLNKCIIASNLNVHKEQGNKNTFFFNPSDHIELSNIMLKVMDNDIKIESYDYSVNIEKFGNEFMNMLQTIF